MTVGETIPLDGSGSSDPDGDDDFLQDEQWTQLSGPPITIEDASEEVAYVTFSKVGTYVFQLSISDGQDSDTDTVTMTVVAGGTTSCLTDGLQALYTFQKGSGTTVHDVSGVGAPLNLTVESSGASWLAGSGLVLNSPTLAASSGPATKMIDALQAANVLSIEVWITPANITQDEPIRIVTISANECFGTQCDAGARQVWQCPQGYLHRSITYDRRQQQDDNGEPSIASTIGACSPGGTAARRLRPR